MNHCPSCRNVYYGADGKLRCRLNGRIANPARAELCKDFDREPGADDEELVWFDDAWHVSGEGRGD